MSAHITQKAKLHRERLVGAAFGVPLQDVLAPADGAHAIPHLLRVEALEEHVSVVGDAVEEGFPVHQTRSFFASSVVASVFPSGHATTTVCRVPIMSKML